MRGLFAIQLVKFLGAFLAFVFYSAGQPSKAVTELITNGDFESGSFSGWTKTDQIGSDGTFFIVPNSGGIAPSSGLPYQLNPTGGNWFSMTDSQGPGSHSLTQAFTITTGTIVNYSFQMFANNWGEADFNNGRDFATPTLVQNAVVDIITGSDPLTTTDIVAVLFGPGSDLPGAPPNPWTTYTGTRFLLPGTYQIRFAETDNVFFFNQGVDNVSISIGAETPLPGALTLFVTGLGALGLLGCRRKKKAATLVA